MPLKEDFKKLLKLIGADTRQGLIGYLVGVVITTCGGLLYLSKTLLNYFITFLNINMPLWAILALNLIVLVYTYLKTGKLSKSSNVSKYKIKYFTIFSYKWKTLIYNDSDNYFEVDEIPRCNKHDLPMLKDLNDYSWYCPEFPNKTCKSYISKENYSEIYNRTKSYIDKEIRNKNY